MPNAWNIQTFTIYLLTFDQFWWNFTWQGIFAFPIWWVNKIFTILKSSLNLRKISIFFYSLPKNSGKSTNNRFRAKLVKYSNFYDIFTDVWPILMKFHVARHIRPLELMSDQKFVNFKIQVDRRRPTRKLRKMSIFFYSLAKNSKKSANNCFDGKRVKYSNFYDIFANVWPILMKFHVARHIRLP